MNENRCRLLGPFVPRTTGVETSSSSSSHRCENASIASAGTATSSMKDIRHRVVERLIEYMKSEAFAPVLECLVAATGVAERQQQHATSSLEEAADFDPSVSPHPVGIPRNNVPLSTCPEEWKATLYTTNSVSSLYHQSPQRWFSDVSVLSPTPPLRTHLYPFLTKAPVMQAHYHPVENAAPVSTNQELGQAAPGEKLLLITSKKLMEYKGAKCSHATYWKRLRARKGLVYFSCLYCGAHWHIASRGVQPTPGKRVDRTPSYTAAALPSESHSTISYPNPNPVAQQSWLASCSSSTTLHTNAPAASLSSPERAQQDENQGGAGR